MNWFFDLDQISPIGRSCGHYTFNLICSRRIIRFQRGATKSSGGANMMIFKKSKKLKLIENHNARCFASNDIDFWSRKNHIAEKKPPKLKQICSSQFKNIENKSQKLKGIENHNVRFSASNSIDCWSRTIHVAEKSFFEN